MGVRERGGVSGSERERGGCEWEREREKGGVSGRERGGVSGSEREREGGVSGVRERERGV